MSGHFSSHRLGRSQLLAGSLLLIFLAQSAWLVRQNLKVSHLEPGEQLRLDQGLRQWQGGLRATIAGTPAAKPEGENPSLCAPFSEDAEIAANRGYDPEHSPLWYLVGAAPLALGRRSACASSSSIFSPWFARLPFLACGLFLGASLWYVSRRLCGKIGGFVALVLYCFSPAMIRASAVWHADPEIFAAWGAFGSVFTAIAVAHTLYAPHEVVLWNWRRIVLLGIALAIAVGSQFSMIAVVPLALAFLLYVAPVRQRAAFVIWLAACLVGLIALFAAYFFHADTFVESLRHAAFWGATWRGFVLPAVYKQVTIELMRACPAFALVIPTLLAVYVVWPRTRYFGNTAPLLVAILFIILGIAHPHVAGAGFLLAAVPFLFIFVAGVLADLMETQRRALVTACVVGMLLAYVIWSLRALAQVPPG
jgi:hypothetical protein